MTADYPLDSFERMIATNVRGMFVSMKHELAQMQSQGFGSIVNISSGAGLVGVAGFAAYSASKWAEVGMTKSAALEYAKHGIRINAIAPAWWTPRYGRLPRQPILNQPSGLSRHTQSAGSRQPTK